ncbi:hypothetical protein HPT27_05890 [Permianibacter sp. IMCC34836]|uniref:hypothetical protein n=1 Tax=Permianibacter fluminis TaxID=2738515 RepID=UPI001557CC07|nr:hypothetical protein [Permianibacter fluminis]NQD36548.1 hypothetical protein [Permianibacter fluminis]
MKVIMWSGIAGARRQMLTLSMSVWASVLALNVTPAQAGEVPEPVMGQMSAPLGDQTSDPIRDINVTLLTSPNVVDTRTVSRMLDKRQPADLPLLDLIAERLYQELDAGVTERSEDAVAWLGIVLGHSGDNRYAEVLQLGQSKTDSRKIRNAIKAASKDLRDLGHAAYQRGSVSLAQERARAEAALAEHRHAADIVVSEQQLIRQRLPEVMTRLGTPDYLSSMDLNINDKVKVPARTDAVLAHYDGFGIVVFSVAPSGDHWIVDKLWQDRSKAAAAYQGSNARLANILASVGGKYFRLVLHASELVVLNDPELLKVLERRLAGSLDVTEPHEVAALERVCTLLVLSTDPRFAATLERVAADAASSDLRGRAKGSLGSLRNRI